MKKRFGRSRKVFIQLTMLTCICGMICGCDDKSTFYRTQDISADMEVTSLSDYSTVVKVYLRADDENLDLSGPDRLEATADGQEKELRAKHDHYQTVFSNLDGGTEITISFLRSGWDNAKKSEVILPDRFEISQPDRNAMVNGSTPITFTWSRSGTGDNMWLQATYDCQQTSPGGGTGNIGGTGPRFNIDDREGSTSLTLMDLLDVTEPADTYDLGCRQISVKIVRERFGRIDSDFESGDISGRQERCVELRYQP